MSIPMRRPMTYLKGREYAPKEDAWDRALADWESLCSDPDAPYDDRIAIDAETIVPMVTWGVSVAQSVPIGGTIPDPDSADGTDGAALADAVAFMGWQPGQAIAGTRIDVAYIGSFTNGRLSDFLAVAELIAGRNLRVAPHVKAIIVPGSQRIREELVARGLDRVFIGAGFEFREAGCSMCLALNPDRLQGREAHAGFRSLRVFSGSRSPSPKITSRMKPARRRVPPTARRCAPNTVLQPHAG